MKLIVSSCLRSLSAATLLASLAACGGGLSSDGDSDARPTQAGRAKATADTTAWAYCTWQGGTCSFSGTRQVRYGTSDKYVTKTFTGSTPCTDAVFGDPAYGIRKSCWVATTTTAATTTTPTTPTTPTTTPTTTTTTWAYCTWQGGTCSFTGTRQVRYGANSSWVVKSVTNGTVCSDAVFGDPIYGVRKACYLASASTAGTATSTGTSSGTGTGTGTGTSTSSGGTSGGTSTVTSMMGTTASTGLNTANCVASGIGRDIQVGEGAGQIPTLDQVPWESLTAGDTVRIFYKATPYRGKILLAAKGTAAAPVRVCGVKGPAGQRPIIDGAGAVARRGLSYTAASVGNIQETRSVIHIDRLGSQDWATAYPTFVQIDGLEIRGARPGNTFTNSAGGTQAYVDFGGCIWIERGQNISIVDNDIHDCTNGIFSKSSDDGDFSVTKNIRIAGNSIYGNGVVGDEHQHNVYMQSVGVVYEFNRFASLRAGAKGNAIKDRSVGTVVRFNRIDEGAHAIDLVEAEDFPVTALKNPAYRSAYVYGNQITKTGDTGSFIHYGGDHYGSKAGANWGEPLYRQGTLYFFHNTVIAKGTTASLFQLSTTLERAEVWNNAFVFASTVAYPSLRQSSEVGAGWTPGGIVNLGRNWISAGWADNDPWHTIPGRVDGVANMVSSGMAAPVDTTSYAPISGSSLVNSAQTNLGAIGVHQPNYQLNAYGSPVARGVNGGQSDLGAVEN